MSVPSLVHISFELHAVVEKDPTMTCICLYSPVSDINIVVGVNIFASTSELFNVVRQHLATLNFPINVFGVVEIVAVNFTTGWKVFYLPD